MVKEAAGLSTQEVARLLAAWQERLYALALNVLGNPADAEDAVQNAALAILRSAPRFRRGEPVAPWVWRIATNAAVDVLRRRRGKEEAMSEEPAAAEADVARPEAEEMRTAVRAAVQGLPAEERTSVVLHYFHGLGYRDVARVLGAPEGTVSARISRGRDRLRARLAAFGGALAVLPVATLEQAMAGAGREQVPAGLSTRLAHLARNRSAVARSVAAGKGGLGMKLVAGIVLAGAIAGVAAVSLPGREAPASPSPPKGPPGHEHVASVNAYGNDLDGPAREALGFRGGLPDMQGNLWGGRWLRASDGRVLRMGAYEYGTLGFNLEEGPIVGRPVQFVGTTYGWNCGGSAILGSPDAGGKNDGIYESLGKKGQLVRLWRNKEKGDRWWFARVAGGGDAAAPKKRGESADALKVKFEWIHQPQVGLDGKIRFLAEHAFYMLEDGKVTCVLAPDDYEQATAAMKGLPRGGYAGGDGSFYLGYYYSSGAAYKGEAAAIWRVAPDGKVEPYAQSHGHSAGDGDALTQGGWFCGPHLHKHRSARFIPADAMLTSAHDEDFIRRIQNRRVATLCTDGEWREFGAGKKRGALTACGMVIGPNGTVYHTYRSWVDVRLWRYTGLDLAKPPAITRSNGGR